MLIVLISASVCISLVMSLLFCLCWKRRTPKNEWLGVDGMVTQKNPDENVNHLPSADTCMNGSSNGDASDKRNTITNSRRSLPDIPSEMTAGVTWDGNGDNSSEHYATLGQYQNPGDKISSAKGPDVRTSISQHSSISQADDTFSPYERVKYDKIKAKEHPYAQVQPNMSRNVVYEEGLSSSEERTTLLRVDVPSTSANPTTPVRSRRSSAQSNEPVDVIPAASAVAGGIAASYELPYMTPPINFSGDSVDSSKGYTSISVREPLANILAQTSSSVTKQKRKLDVHYSTVSDDSDDVYTTIPDPNNPIYTSESETYARIPPLPITVEAEINNPPNERCDSVGQLDQLYEVPPESVPPTVENLKHATSHHTHSRQASSSSSANFGSPKPEKRQANSPLPPPPPDGANTDIHLSDKLQVKRNLDDLYAKVQKNRKDEITDDGFERISFNENNRTSVEVNESDELTEHNYETLKKSSTTNSDFGYEKIKGHPDSEPGYASINGPDSLAASDSGYEALRQDRNIPNYEELKLKTLESTTAGYSVVNKRKKNLTTLPEDLTYKHLPNQESDPNYAGLKSSGSESDPNYESVNQSDPNYESVKDLEPFYDGVTSQGAQSDSESAGYEKIFKSQNNVSESSNSRTTDSEPPYEQLRNEVDSIDIPGYEKVGSSASGSSGNEIEPIQNEETDLALNIHDEDAVVQV